MTETDTVETAKREVAAAAGGSAVERLARHLGSAASVRTVFGEPVERGGMTIIPVARVRVALGGADTAGDAVGGGADARPYGYIRITQGKAEFTRIREPWVSVVVPLAAAATAAVLPELARRVMRARRSA
ncbi:MAG TPA: hypothetical protein VGL93_24135 [Streptosporangiaceae bacterium]|jgi:uncharacterized spore protein YtfJ